MGNIEWQDQQADVHAKDEEEDKVKRNQKPVIESCWVWQQKGSVRCSLVLRLHHPQTQSYTRVPLAPSCLPLEFPKYPTSLVCLSTVCTLISQGVYFGFCNIIFCVQFIKLKAFPFGKLFSLFEY